jgi:CIC family chloride channel protein
MNRIQAMPGVFWTRVRRGFSDYGDRLWSYESAVMMALAIVVGLGAGFGIALFRRALDTLFQATVGGIGQTLPLAILILPAVGGLLTAAWLRVAGREGETGLGVSGIMEAVGLHGGRIGLRGSVARIIGAILTVGLGGSAGPEDPSVQIGATIGSQVGLRLRLSEARVKTLVGCGAAAGISAAFNAPITGVFFAIEIILGEFAGASLGWVVLASVAGAVASQSVLGSAPAFVIPAYELRTPAELLLYMALGVLAAPVAVAYIFLLDRIEAWFEKWQAPHWLKPAVGGLAVGVLAFFGSTAIMGPGYAGIGQVLQGGNLNAAFLFLLVALKLVATPLTIGSGGQGGLFAPSLFLGAMLGAGFGVLAHSVFGSAIAPSPAYSLVGMGAVLAGAIRAPITGLMLPFEMTQDYHIILPLMFAVVISTVMAQLFQHESVYTLKLSQRGINLRARGDVNLMRTIQVSEAMTPLEELTVMRKDDPLGVLTEAFETTMHHGFIVLDEHDEFYGVVTLADVERMLTQKRMVKTIGEITTTNATTVYPDETLDDALRSFGAMDVGRIPVVERRNPKRVLGMVRRADIISAYSRALLDKQEFEHRHERLRLEALARTELMEIRLDDDSRAAQKRIKDLQLPEDSVVVAIRRGSQTIVPRGNSQLHVGDLLIILCKPALRAQIQEIFHRASKTD